MREHLATLLTDFRRHGSRIAIVTHRGNRSFASTWGDLAELSTRFAGELDRRNLQPGDRVLIWGDNSAEWMAAFFGCVLRGVVAVPIDAAGGADFARRVVDEVQPKLLAGNRDLLTSLKLPQPIPWLTFDGFQSLPAPEAHPIPPLSRDTPLQIVFTSGTTAEPKGIVHTHGNVLASLDPLEREFRKYRGYEHLIGPLRILHTLPLSHVFGQFMGLWIPPLITAEVHYESRLEAPRLIRTIGDERISVLVAVPRVLEILRAQLTTEMPELPAKLAAAAGHSIWKRWWRFRKLHRRFGLKFWAFISGGATVLPELESFWTTLGFALIQGYGMTETTALVTLNHPFKPTQGSIGKPLAGREVRLGQDGEILVRGASVSNRLWHHGRIEQRAEDWLQTGDLATRNAAGELVFAGRKKDVIVTSAGLNIYPEDLEAALRRQPGVRDVVVLSYASPTGPAPAAVLMVRADVGSAEAASAAEGAVVAANRELAGFQQILYWLVWPQPDFPRTSTGKVLRRQIQSWMQQSLSASGSPTAAPGDALIEELHRLQPATRDREIADSDRLAEDLHLDSLAMVQLQTVLETRFGLEIADSQPLQTIGDLRRLLHQSQAGQPPSAAAGAAVPAPPPTQENLPAPPHAAIPGTFPRWPWWPVVRMVRTVFLEGVAIPLVRLLLGPKIEAGKPAVKLQRPSLLIANHVTSFDVPIILSALPAADRRRVAVAMAGEMLTGWRQGKAERHRMVRLLTPVAYWLVIALFNVFPLLRRNGLRRSFEHAGRALDRGYHVLVFPEGRRSADVSLQRFEPGIGLLAQESQVPVQPIYVDGLGPLKLGTKSWFRSGTVTVRRGQPLYLNPEEQPAEFTQRLYQAVEDLAKIPE